MSLFRGVLIGRRGVVALGRFWLSVCLALAAYFWLARPAAEFPPTLENVIGFLLAYNLGGKFSAPWVGRGRPDED